MEAPRKNGDSDSEPGLSAPDVPSEGAAANPCVPAARGMRAWEWMLLGFIMLVGAGLRCAYLCEIRNAPDFDAPGLDPEYHDYWARALLSGDWTPAHGQPDPEIPTSPFLKPPGYPYFLASIYWLSDGSYVAIRVVQMALGLVNVLLVFMLARALFGSAVGLVSSAFVACYWVFIYFEGELNAPVIIVLLTLATMNLLRLWLATGRKRWAFLAGASAGLLALFRPEVLAMTAFLAPWMCWGRRSHERFATSLLSVAGLLAGFALAVSPVTVRNYRASGEFVLICTMGGINVYGGNNDRADGTWPQVDYRELFGVSRELSDYDAPFWREQVEKKLGATGMTHGQVSRYFSKLAWDYIRAHPRRTFELMARRAALFWGPREVSNNKVIFYEKRHSRVLRWMPGFPVVLGLALGGLFAMAASRPCGYVSRAMVLLLLAYVAFSCAVYLPIQVAGRYRVPIIPFLSVFGAYVICRIGILLREGHWVRGGGWAALSAVLVAVSHIPLADYEYSEAKWHFDRACAYSEKGDYAASEREARLAIRSPGALPAYWLTLSDACDKQGEDGEAMSACRRSFLLDPRNADACNKLGYLYHRQGRFDTALSFYRRALDENPGLISARANEGFALRDLGRLDEAARAFETVLKQAPKDLSLIVGLAQVEMARQRYADAAALYGKALAIAPDSPSIREANARANAAAKSLNAPRTESP